MNASMTVEQELNAVVSAITSTEGATVKQRAVMAQWALDVEKFDALTDEEIIEVAIVSGNALAAALAHRLTLAQDNLHGR